MGEKTLIFNIYFREPEIWGPPRGFRETGEQGHFFFRGTGEQRPKNKGNTGNFGEQKT